MTGTEEHIEALQNSAHSYTEWADVAQAEQLKAIAAAGGDQDDVIDFLIKKRAIFENARNYNQWRMDLITEEIHRIQKTKIS